MALGQLLAFARGGQLILGSVLGEVASVIQADAANDRSRPQESHPGQNAVRRRDAARCEISREMLARSEIFGNHRDPGRSIEHQNFSNWLRVLPVFTDANIRHTAEMPPNCCEYSRRLSIIGAPQAVF